MINIVIACGGGFSSSFIASRIEKDFAGRNLDKEFSVTFLPLAILKERHENVDVAMLCPHLRYQAESWLEKERVSFPVYMIPSRLYALIDADIIIEDAVDIIEIFRNNPANPACFPGEEDCIHNKRETSYRRFREKN